MNGLKQAGTFTSSWLDEIFSGRWWWRALRHVAGIRVERALDSFGDKSMEARCATERYREMQFAVTYWRSAPSPVRQVVRYARQAGINDADLKLIVLNTDLRVHGNRVVLRRSTLSRILSSAMATVVISHWILICAMTAFAPCPLWVKIIVLIALTCAYGALHRGWSLYASRPLVAIERSGVALDDVCRLATAGTVEYLPSNQS